MSVKLIARNLDTAKINIDSAYQRLVVKSQVNWIVKHYDEVAFGRLLVAERGDGTLWCVDGQQRLNAAQILDMPIVPCLTFQSKGRQNEALVFKQINADRRGVKPMEVFKALLEAREPEAVAIQAVSEECGYKIAQQSTTETTWAILRSISKVRGIYKRGGSELLRQTLSYISELWAGDTQATHNIVLGGVSFFLQKANNCEEYQHERMTKKLKAQGPMTVIRYVTDYARLAGSHNNDGMFAGAMLVMYNKGLRKNSKLQIRGIPDLTAGVSQTSEEAAEQ
jgi:hypothetical protein